MYDNPIDLHCVKRRATVNVHRHAWSWIYFFWHGSWAQENLTTCKIVQLRSRHVIYHGRDILSVNQIQTRVHLSLITLRCGGLDPQGFPLFPLLHSCVAQRSATVRAALSGTRAHARTASLFHCTPIHLFSSCLVTPIDLFLRSCSWLQGRTVLGYLALSSWIRIRHYCRSKLPGILSPRWK